MAQEKVYTRQNGRPRPAQAGSEPMDGDGKFLLAVTKGSGAGSGGADGNVHIRAAGGSDTGIEINVNGTWTPTVKKPASFTENGVARYTAAGQLADGPTIGTSANQLVQLTASGKLPAVSAENLTSVPDQHTHSNKTTLDGINQGLATTSNVTHANITATGTLMAGALNVQAGTTIGDLVQLVSVSGSPGLPAVDGSNLTNLPTSIVQADTVVKEITSSGHGFAVGDWIKCTGTNAYAKAQADSEANANVVGVVTQVVSSSIFKLTMSGYVYNPTAVPDVLANSQLYLSPTVAGAPTTTKPTTAGQFIKPLAVVTESENAMVVNVLTSVEVIGGAGSGDVIGPAGVTANTVAQFDGATGKLIKQGPLIGTAISNLVQLTNVGGSAALPAVDGSLLSNLPGLGGGTMTLMFSYINLTPSITSAEVDLAGVNVSRLPIIKAGSIVGSSARLSSTLTGGTILLEPTINGTVVTNDALDLSFSLAGETEQGYASVAHGQTGLTFTAGQALGVKITTNAALAPEYMDVVCTLFFDFN